MTILNDTINLTFEEKEALSRTKTYSYSKASGIIFTDNHICWHSINSIQCKEYLDSMGAKDIT